MYVRETLIAARNKKQSPFGKFSSVPSRAGKKSRRANERASETHRGFPDLLTEIIVNVVDDCRKRISCYVGHDVGRSYGVCSPPRCCELPFDLPDEIWNARRDVRSIPTCNSWIILPVCERLRKETFKWGI